MFSKYNNNDADIALNALIFNDLEVNNTCK